jgi:transposase-like protein
VINGNATQAQIARAFGVPLVTVKRYVKLYREGGPGAFFAPAKKRSASKLSPLVCQEVQALLDQGLEVPEVGRRVGILANTLHKAIRSGRLRGAKKKSYPPMLLRAPRANAV